MKAKIFLIMLTYLLFFNDCKKDKDTSSDTLLSDSWESYTTRDDGEERGPILFIIAQTGINFTIQFPCFEVSGEGTVSGNDLTFTMQDNKNNNNLYFTGKLSDENSISGTWSEDGPFTGTWNSIRINDPVQYHLADYWSLFQEKVDQVQNGPMILKIDQQGSALTLSIPIIGLEGKGMTVGNIINYFLYEPGYEDIRIYSLGKMMSSSKMTGSWFEDGSTEGTWRADFITDTTVIDLTGNWNVFSSGDSQEELNPKVLTIIQHNNDITLYIATEGIFGEGLIAGNVVNFVLHSIINSDEKNDIFLFGELIDQNNIYGMGFDNENIPGTWWAIRI